MAYTDYDQTTINSGTAVFEGDDDGDQQINADLSSPLTLQGSDSRKWVISTAGVTEYRRTVLTVDNTLYPDFTGIPDTKAVSVRAWLRVAPETNSLETAQAGIGVKAWTIAGGNPTGYWLGFGRGVTWNNTGPNKLTMAFIDAAGVIREQYADIYVGSADTWTQFRLDVIPTLNGAAVDRDTIRAYRNSGTEAAPVWTLIREEVVLDTDPAWIPWGDATKTRVSFMADCRHWGVSPRRAAFIDTFEALLKDR